MTTTDWIVDIALVLIVVRQLREEKLTKAFILLPAGIVAFVAHKYLHTIPTSGHDLVLLAVAVTTGLALGTAGGLLTKVRGHHGVAYVRAGTAAAALWIGSMTARLGFIIWITHSGQHQLATFSIHHQLTGQAWQTALVLLALSEVAARIAVIVYRGHTAAHHSTTQPARPDALTTA